MTSPINFGIDAARAARAARVARAAAAAPAARPAATAGFQFQAAKQLKSAIAKQDELSELNTFVSKPRGGLFGLLKKIRVHNEASLGDQLTIKDAQNGHTTSRDAQLLAVKDNIVTLHSRTTCGSGMLSKHRSPFEASIVERFRGKPCLEVGKTNLDEFGMGSHSTNSFFGIVHRDLGKQYSAGGSSGGSAVAVATKQCQIALGTDTGGSVRLPAAYNGVVGFKPSYGLVSRWGVIPYANSLDTVGVFAPTAAVAEQFSQIALIHDPKDPTSISASCRQRMKDMNPDFDQSKFSLKGLKVGIPIEYNIEELDPSIRQSWQDALTLLRDEGCTLVPISLPNTKHALSAYYVLAASEAASNLSKYDGIRYGSRNKCLDGAGDVLYSQTRGGWFGVEVKRRILLGSYALSSEAVDNYFIQAQKVRRLVQKDFDQVFRLPNPLRPRQQFDLSDLPPSVELNDKLGPSQVDFIVCPTAPTPAPTLASILGQTPVDTYMNDVFTVPSSLAGLPAISMPFPICKEDSQTDTAAFAGIQIIGQYGDDGRLIHTAKEFEKAVGRPRFQIKATKLSVDVVWTDGVQTIKRIEQPHRFVLTEDIPESLRAPRLHDQKKVYRTFIEDDKVVITSWTPSTLLGRTILKRAVQELPLSIYGNPIGQVQGNVASDNQGPGSLVKVRYHSGHTELAKKQFSASLAAENQGADNRIKVRYYSGKTEPEMRLRMEDITGPREGTE